MNTQEFQQYSLEQFSNISQFQQFVKDQFTKVATKEDISEVYLNMATKSELAEVKEIVIRLDKRSDEDIRATMKDVEKIKGVLNQQGYQI